jgi:hypothetical protein
MKIILKEFAFYLKKTETEDWTFEITPIFSYYKSTPVFYYFRTNDCFVGFNFLKDCEAKKFYKRIAGLNYKKHKFSKKISINHNTRTDKKVW